MLRSLSPPFSLCASMLPASVLLQLWENAEAVLAAAVEAEGAMGGGQQNSAAW